MTTNAVELFVRMPNGDEHTYIDASMSELTVDLSDDKGNEAKLLVRASLVDSKGMRVDLQPEGVAAFIVGQINQSDDKREAASRWLTLLTKAISNTIKEDEDD